MQPYAVSRTWQRIRKAVGLPQIRLHDLRHSCASLLLHGGENPLMVSRRLGHASVGFTMTVYGHVMPGAQRDGAEKLAALFGNGRRQALAAAG